MGHANKSIIDKVYGKYREALEKDKEAMKDHNGEDFWNPYEKTDDGRPWVWAAVILKSFCGIFEESAD